MGEVLALLDAPLEAVPRAGGGRGAVGDVDAAKTARLASRARQGASDGGAAHRGLLLDEVDADTAACGVLERPLGLAVEAVALKIETAHRRRGRQHEGEQRRSGV